MPWPESAELEYPGSGDELCDASFDVVEGVGERGELLYGVLLALARGSPVPHRRHRRRGWFDRYLLRSRV